MVPKSITAISHDEKEELKKKGIKSPSKLLSPQYLSPAPIKELNKNPSAPNRVHFVYSIVILSTKSDTDEDDTSSTSIHKHKLDDMVKGSKEIKEQSKEEDGIETDMEVEEVIEEEESEFETDEEVEEIFDEEEEDEDDESFNLFPTMKELSHHEWLLRSRQKLSKPDKISNFVGRVKHIKIFIGSFTYQCDFMILEDTGSIIDRHLGEMVFGKPFIDETNLVYSEENGTVMFKQGDEKITFRMPYTMEIFKQTRLMGFSIDSIPPFAYEENFGLEKTHYYQSLLIGDEYKQDDGGRRGIRHLMRHFITTVSYKLMLFDLTKDAAVQLLLLEDVIRQDLRLDDVDRVECLPNEEIFVELARMGYEKPPPKLTFYKVFFSAQWKFLIHTLVQCVSAKRTVWNEFSCSMASAGFANIRRVGKGFLVVKTPLFVTMLVQPQEEEEEEDEIPNAPSPPSEQDLIPIPHTIPLALPPQEQPTATSESTMSLLNTLMETVLPCPKRVKSSNDTIMGAQEDASKQEEKIEAIDADGDITLEDIDWNSIAEQIKEKHLDNIRKYQSLKRKHVSIAQARKNMIIYLKNMAGYKMEHFRGMTNEKVRPIFKREYKKVQTLFKPDKYVEEPQKKRVAEVTLLQESFKKLKAIEVSGSDST
nr:protein kinase-like domain, concanavalin A-like lectin/glucanase domain protein [Tanacetum cinerariifolium]